MQQPSEIRDFQMQREQLRSFRLALPMCLLVRQGRIWLTVSGDEYDYWLADGETLNLPADAHIVLSVEAAQAHLSLTPCTGAARSVATVKEKNSLPPQPEYGNALV